MRQKQSIFSLFLLSPSSRRAWIEIPKTATQGGISAVALLAEGADRNICYINGTDYLSGRLSATSCATK